MQGTESWRAALARGREAALELGHGEIAPVHMAIAALEQPDELTDVVLQTLGFEPQALAAILRAAVPAGTYVVGVSGGPDLAYTSPGVRVLSGAQDEAVALGHRFVHPLHTLLAVLRDPTANAGRLLRRAGVDPGALQAALRVEVP